MGSFAADHLGGGSSIQHVSSCAVMPRLRTLTPTQWQATTELMNKGLDATFVHYGIRKDDLALIHRLAHEAGLPEEWLDGVLKAYHEKKVRNESLEDKDIQRLLNEQLDRI